MKQDLFETLSEAMRPNGSFSRISAAAEYMLHKTPDTIGEHYVRSKFGLSEDEYQQAESMKSEVASIYFKYPSSTL